MKARVIYMVEVYKDGELVFRGFERNKRNAERTARIFKGDDTAVRKLSKAEMTWVDPMELE